MCIVAVAVFLIISIKNLVLFYYLVLYMCYVLFIVTRLRSDITGFFITSEYAATGLWAGSPLSRDLALRPAPGSQSSVCVVVVAVFLIFCIIYFYMFFNVQLTLLRC